jgi:hypothetical protein
VTLDDGPEPPSAEATAVCAITGVIIGIAVLALILFSRV